MITCRRCLSGWLTGSLVATGLPLMAPLAAPGLAIAAPAAAPPLKLLMVQHTAVDQQEHARDYAAGITAVIQSAQRGGSGRALQLVTVSVDGSATSLDGISRQMRADPAVVATVGCSSERLSLALIERLTRDDLHIAHLAPWLPNSRLDERDDLVNLFASREQQMAHTVRSLEAMGLRQFALVFDGPSSRDLSLAGLQTTLRPLRLQPPVWTAPADGAVEELAQRMPADLPPVLVMAGGTLEFARLARALSLRGLRRMLVSLYDLDTVLLQQLGTAREQPVVLTQVVPSPAQQGLLDEVRRRTDVDLDGYSLRFSDGRNRGGQFVTQTLLTPDGRLVG